MNLVDHINLEASTPLSLPLKKCIYGTVLHVSPNPNALVTKYLLVPRCWTLVGFGLGLFII